MFQLTETEIDFMVSQNAIPSRKYLGGSLPYVFTEQGVAKQLALDLKKHNQQYPSISIKTFKEAHDRFLIIDGKEIYHLGVSLKDLGKKWFAFSRFETGAVAMLRNLEGVGYGE